MMARPSSSRRRDARRCASSNVIGRNCISLTYCCQMLPAVVLALAVGGVYSGRDPLQSWALNVMRRVQSSGVEDSWTPAERAKSSFLGQSGTLDEVGGNVRWGVTPNLTMSGTVNPDFSQNTLCDLRALCGSIFLYRSARAVSTVQSPPFLRSVKIHTRGEP